MADDEIKITISLTDNASAGLTQVQNKVAGLGGVATTANKGVGGLSTGMVELGKSILGPVLAFASVTGAISLFTNTLKAAIAGAAEEETSLVTLAATIKSMGQESNVSADGIRAMGEELMKTTAFTHEAYEAASKYFLRIEGFDASKLSGMMQTLADFAAGTGQSLEAASEGVARALETGQTRSLGFSAALRKQVQEMIAAGDQAGALSLIMETLGEKYGGQAAAQMETYTGKVMALKNSWGELLATMGGEALGPGKGIVDTINQAIVAMTQLLQLSEAGGGGAGGLGMSIALRENTDETIRRGEAQKILNDLLREQWRLEHGGAWKGPEAGAQDASVAQGIENITNAYTAQAEAAYNAGIEGVGGLEAQAAAAEQAANTLKEHQAAYSGIIGFANSYDKIAGSIAAKEAEIAAYRAKYGEAGPGFQKLTDDLAALEEQQTQLTNTFLLSMYSIKLAADGFQDADVAAYLGFATALGVISEDAKNAALALWGTYDAQIALVNAPTTPPMPEFGVTPGVIPQGVGSVVMPNLPATAEAATAAGNLDTIAGSANGLALNLNEANTNAGKLAEAIGKIPPDFTRLYDMTFRITTQYGAQSNWTGGWLASGGPVIGPGAFVGDAPGGGMTPYTEFIERKGPDKWFVHNAAETRAMVASGQITSRAGGGVIGGGTFPAPPSANSGQAGNAMLDEMRALRYDIIVRFPKAIRDAIQQIV